MNLRPKFTCFECHVARVRFSLGAGLTNKVRRACHRHITPAFPL